MDSLRTLFGNEVSKSAFKVVDGVQRMIGKWGQVEIIGEYFDIWLVKPDLSPMTNQKMTHMLKKLPQAEGYRRLTGEAYYQTTDIEVVRDSLPVLGIKKKRRVSEQTRLDKIAILVSIRNN